MSIRRGAVAGVWALSLLAAACRGSSHTDQSPAVTPTPTPPPPDNPPDTAPGLPVTRGNWTYYGVGQGLSQDIQDVSPDEGGNVYVAGGDAVYVKRKADQKFLRFDSTNSTLTASCNDPAYIYTNDVPPTPFHQCRVISVAGAAPGQAIVGFDGFLQGQVGGSARLWALFTGGADLVSFDGEKGALTTTRHVYIASPPHVVCHADGTERPLSGTCSDPNDDWWNLGRRLVRKIFRVVVNHDSSSPMYGDAWFGSDHGTFSALLANADARGLPDRTAGYPEYAEAKGTWEHLHPAIAPANTALFVSGDGYALSIDPRNGRVWGSNEFRTAYVTGYGPDLHDDHWWMGPINTTTTASEAQFLDVWPDPTTPTDVTDPSYAVRFYGGTRDDVRSIANCMDGALWVGSTTHGLARIDPDTLAVSYLALPRPELGGVTAVACDPSDGSLWIGRGWRDWSVTTDFAIVGGGLMRYRSGSFETIDTTGLPEFANHPVQSIQIDRWSTPRVLYFAFHPTVDSTGKITAAGGVASYDGT
jgi:hypothetical protein